MQQFISQIMLPIILAFVMLGMGTGLQLSDFQRVIARPKAFIIGASLQIFFLPALALIIIAILPLSPLAAAGLFLVSLCPGGATSNLFTYLARGDLALSVSLTGFVSLLSPFILPVIFVSYLQLTHDSTQHFSMPLGLAIKKLTMVTLLPITVGMIIRHFFPLWSNTIQPSIKKSSSIAMISVVFALMFTNMETMLNMFSMNAVAILTLSTVSLISAYIIARKLNLDEPIRRSIAIEIGVQNAGTAMMVAFTILNKPELAAVPLMYGLLMNIPAFAFIVWVQDKAAIEYRI